MTPIERKLILRALLALLNVAAKEPPTPNRKKPMTAREYVERMNKIQDIEMRRSA